jgi:hypothetical protein
MKINKAIIATILFGCLLFAIYYIHIVFFRINVIFYAAIADAVIASLAAGIVLFSLNYFNVFNYFEKSQLLIIWLLCGYGFSISIPTVIDRSLSFYILEKLQQRGGGIQQERIKDVFIKEYLPEYRLVDVRLTEQLESGTIAIKDGCVILTSKGNQIASFGQFFRKHLLPGKRLLMGEYTDDLTNPFSNSKEAPDYTCQ